MQTELGIISGRGLFPEGDFNVVQSGEGVFLCGNLYFLVSFYLGFIISISIHVPQPFSCSSRHLGTGAGSGSPENSSFKNDSSVAWATATIAEPEIVPPKIAFSKNRYRFRCLGRHKCTILVIRV